MHVLLSVLDARGLGFESCIQSAGMSQLPALPVLVLCVNAGVGVQ